MLQPLDKIIDRNSDLPISDIVRIAQDYGYTLPEIRIALKAYIDSTDWPRIHSVS